MTRLGRYILSEIGIVPRGLVAPVREQLTGETGNSAAIPAAALLKNLTSLEEKLQQTTGMAIPFPVDRTEAEYIFFPAASDYLMETGSLMGTAAVLHAADVSWTIGSNYFDANNFGLFYSDWVLEQVINKMIAEAQRLKVKKILIGESGPAARAAKQFGPTFAQNGSSPPVVSMLELTGKAIKEGKIELDSGAIKERVTYHDPCNIARSGWLVKQPRQILRSFVKDFVEMKPGKAKNYCCGGGGGLVWLDEAQDFRMQVAGKIKAEQIRATGAEIVATPCTDCKKQLREIVEYHELPVDIVGVHDLILRAIRL
jgi:Fe-S oxidoreductase